jgi:hypothetical protein
LAGSDEDLIKRDEQKAWQSNWPVLRILKSGTSSSAHFGRESVVLADDCPCVQHTMLPLQKNQESRRFTTPKSPDARDRPCQPESSKGSK